VIGLSQSGAGGTQAFDGINLPGISGSGSNCEIKVQYRNGFVGALESMRFFMGYFSNRDTFIDNLKFQGSNDNFVDDI
jgi:hypothetical protein